MQSPRGAVPSGRVGPNAIIGVVEALRAQFGGGVAARILGCAGLSHYDAALPEKLVDEDEVARLQLAVGTDLGAGAAAQIMEDAGRRTGDYLLAHRIPAPARALLKMLPPRLASRLLVRAIARHAWTFAGSGHLAIDTGPPLRLSLAPCPLCRGATSSAPVCGYYTAVFGRLFGSLASRRAHVVEIACRASGAPACVFEITV